MVSEQPKVVDSGVAGIPLDNSPNKELGGAPEVKEKPAYVTMVVLARWRAGLNVEPDSVSSKEWNCALTM